ncbi:hypothetical protein [Kribbella monticola]|nr:hypothetical protein [Kribbella monticola]
MFGKRNVGREWREQYAVAPTCLRSLPSHASTSLRDAEFSPTSGGPPV